MNNDRKTLIRLAASLPKGNEKRRAILAGLQKTAGLGKRVNAEGIIKGYSEDWQSGGRELMMFGPAMSIRDWASTMKKALADSNGTYNDFRVSRVEKQLQRFGAQKVHPAREYSVAVYFLLPKGFDNLKGLMRRGVADEVMTYAGGPDGTRLNGNWDKKPWAETQAALDKGSDVWVRMWWD